MRSRIAGASASLSALDNTPASAAAASSAMVAGAMRTDLETPVFYAAGGGLTNIAAALLNAPRITRRLTLVWIGGPEYPDLAPPPPPGPAPEYNLTIDRPGGRPIRVYPDIDTRLTFEDYYAKLRAAARPR